jgi:hypothetical protein
MPLDIDVGWRFACATELGRPLDPRLPNPSKRVITDPYR